MREMEQARAPASEPRGISLSPQNQAFTGLLIGQLHHFLVDLALALDDAFGLAAAFFALHPHLLHMLHPFKEHGRKQTIHNHFIDPRVETL